MAKSLDEKLKQLPTKRRSKIAARAAELATLKDLRIAAEHTQQELAQALGGSMDIVVKFPNRPSVKLESFAQN